MIAHIQLEGTILPQHRDEAEELPPSTMISAVAHEEDTAAINDENTSLIKPRIKRKQTNKHPNKLFQFPKAQC